MAASDELLSVPEKHIYDYRDHYDQPGPGKQNKTIDHPLGFEVEGAVRTTSRVRGKKIVAVSTFD